MDEQEMLTNMRNMGYLNEKGLSRLIGYLNLEIIDLQPDINKALSVGEPRRSKRCKCGRSMYLDEKTNSLKCDFCKEVSSKSKDVK